MTLSGSQVILPQGAGGVSEEIRTRIGNGGWSTLDNFERATPFNDYMGDTHTWGVESTTPISGTQSGESISAFGKTARNTSISETARGMEYRILFEVPAAGSNIYFGVGSQSKASASALDDNLYQCYVYGGNNQFNANKVKGGSIVKQGTSAHIFNAGITYEARIEYGPVGETDNITVRLFDGPVVSGGSQVAVASITDDEWTGGHWMFYSGNNTAVGWLIDDVASRPL